MRRAHRVDNTHKEMVGDLLRMGFSVADTSVVGDDFPDLVIGRMGLTGMVEVKSPRGLLSARDRLSEGQERFCNEWRGAHVIVSYKAEEVAREFMWWAKKIGAWKHTK
jgi:hypothetical protein